MGWWSIGTDCLLDRKKKFLKKNNPITLLSQDNCRVSEEKQLKLRDQTG